MPLHVHCPNGCVIRMSSNRAGRIVRCPKCKSAIRIPVVDEAALATGEPILCEARIARRRRLDPSLDSDGNLTPPTETALEFGEQETATTEPRAPASVERSANQATVDSLPSDKEADALPARLPVPDLVKPVLRLRPILPESAEQEPEDPEANEALIRLQATIEAPNVILDDPALAKSEDVTKYRSEIFHDADDEAMVAEAEPPQQTERRTEPKPAAHEQVGVVDSEPVEPHSMAEPVTTLAEGRLANEDSSTVEISETSTPERTIDLEKLSKATPVDSIAETLESGLLPTIEEHAFLKSFAPLPSVQADAIPVINLNERVAEAFVAKEETDWEQRLESANLDRKVLARFFAMCLCVVAIVNMAPALYHWYHWTQLAEQMPLPRWIYIQIFVGALHLVYAVFLFQVNDWSAMRAVSVAMLVVAFVFGFVSTGLLVGGGQGNLTSFLGIPYMLSRQACIWCVAMLCLATLMSYWGGKESSNWQRTDDLLKDILARA